jgi:hypothetical protein
VVGCVSLSRADMALMSRVWIAMTSRPASARLVSGLVGIIGVPGCGPGVEPAQGGQCPDVIVNLAIDVARSGCTARPPGARVFDRCSDSEVIAGPALSVAVEAPGPTTLPGAHIEQRGGDTIQACVARRATDLRAAATPSRPYRPGDSIVSRIGQWDR